MEAKRCRITIGSIIPPKSISRVLSQPSTEPTAQAPGFWAPVHRLTPACANCILAPTWEPLSIGDISFPRAPRESFLTLAADGE